MQAASHCTCHLWGQRDLVYRAVVLEAVSSALLKPLVLRHVSIVQVSLIAVHLPEQEVHPLHVQRFLPVPINLRRGGTWLSHNGAAAAQWMTGSEMLKVEDAAAS